MVNNKAIRQALYQKLNVSQMTSLLAGGSAGLIHEVALPSALYPMLVFGKQSGVNTNTLSDDAYKSMLWFVKGVAKDTKSGAAEDIDKAANDLLHNATLSITGATSLYLARASDVEYVETSGDAQFRHVGGLYRLIVTDA